MSNRLIANSALSIWVITVAVLSLIPIDGSDLETVIDYDKIVHIIFYAVMAFLFLNRFHDWKNSILYAILFCAFAGTLLECLQGVIGTGRHFDYYDIIANIIGSLIGCLVYTKINKN